MTIDIHCHLWMKDIPSRSWWDSIVKVSATLANRPEEKIRERLPGWMDTEGDLLVSDMDEAGIDKSILLPIDYLIAGGAGEVASLEDVHSRFAKAAEKHKDRLIAFAGIDPRRPEAVSFLERAVKEWDMKGLKLHPACGFYPDEPCVYRIYEKCMELGLVVLIHVGPEIYPMSSKYAMPMFIDEVANDFPDLKIIMAHAGGCYWEESAMIVSNKLNLYVDLSWWQTMHLALTEEQFYSRVRTLINLAGRSRVLFGSDWPAMRQVRRLNHAAWADVFKEAPQRAEEYGISFTEEEIQMIMHDNAAKLLGIEEES
ncbi:MAG: amidohydrolase [Deltaproteobacteria bacterium]|nr:amidohydrolase [Deltaproteobacteria bacterium]